MNSINTILQKKQHSMTDTLSILIVEDDLSFALELDMLVREIGYNVIGRIDNSAEALEAILSESPDLILMDIDIRGKLTGIEIAQKIKHLPIPILFITSFGQEEYYNQAKETNSIGFLVKPINKYSLQSALEMAIRSIGTKAVKQDNEIQKEAIPQAASPKEEDAFPLKEFLFFKKKNVFQKVKIADILYIEANGDYCVAHTESGSFIASQRLTKMEEMLEQYPFLRVHRSYVVNLKSISSVEPNDNIIHLGDKQIPYSRSNRDALLEQIRMIK